MYIKKSNAVMLLRFEGSNGGTTFTDDVGNTWTPAGNAQTSTSSPKVGSACGAFDGTGDYLDASGLPALGSSVCTVACWFKLNNTTTRFAILGTSGNGAGSVAFWVRYSAANNVAFTQSGGALQTITLSSSLAAGTWYHLAFVRVTGNTWRIFLDGVQQGSDVTSNNNFTNTQYRIAGISIANHLNGYIDDLVVTKEALWTSNFTPPTEGLFVYDNLFQAGIVGPSGTPSFAATAAGKVTCDVTGPNGTPEFKATVESVLGLSGIGPVGTPKFAALSVVPWSLQGVGPVGTPDFAVLAAQLVKMGAVSPPGTPDFAVVVPNEAMLVGVGPAGTPDFALDLPTPTFALLGAGPTGFPDFRAIALDRYAVEGVSPPGTPEFGAVIPPFLQAGIVGPDGMPDFAVLRGGATGTERLWRGITAAYDLRDSNRVARGITASYDLREAQRLARGATASYDLREPRRLVRGATASYDLREARRLARAVTAAYDLREAQRLARSLTAAYTKFLPRRLARGLTAAYALYLPRRLARALTAAYDLLSPVDLPNAPVPPDQYFGPDTWVMNVANGAVSRYSNYAFISYAQYGGIWYGLATNGLYRLLGAPVRGRVMSGGLDFPTEDPNGRVSLSNQKTIVNVYAGVSAGENLTLAVRVDGGQWYPYEPDMVEGPPGTVRFSPGQGLIGRWYELQLEGDGLELEVLEARIRRSSRRV